jgi:hypothetical protein
MRFALSIPFHRKSRSESNRTAPPRPHSLARRFCFAVFGMLSAHCLVAATGITGAVVDDTGHAVAGARILINYGPSVKPPVAAPPVITGPLAATVVADASGSFRADYLPPGQYIACAQATAPGFLDPCHRSASAPGFALGAGQTISGIKIVMPRGAVLRIHVDDPQQLLKPVSGAVDLDFAIHIVTAKGLHYSAAIQSSTPAGRDHAITIPFDTPVSLRAMSPRLAVNDRSGNALAPTGTTVNVPSGTTPAVVGFTISGKKP